MIREQRQQLEESVQPCVAALVVLHVTTTRRWGRCRSGRHGRGVHAREPTSVARERR